LFCTLSETLPTVFAEQIASGMLYTEKYLGPSDMASADEYFEFAEQCIVLASRATSGDKVHLLQMAQAWRDLADKLVQHQNRSVGDDHSAKSGPDITPLTAGRNFEA
jgi:hypothetical protein